MSEDYRKLATEPGALQASLLCVCVCVCVCVCARALGCCSSRFNVATASLASVNQILENRLREKSPETRTLLSYVLFLCEHVIRHATCAHHTKPQHPVPRDPLSPRFGSLASAEEAFKGIGERMINWIVVWAGVLIYFPFLLSAVAVTLVTLVVPSRFVYPFSDATVRAVVTRARARGCRGGGEAVIDGGCGDDLRLVFVMLVVNDC